MAQEDCGSAARSRDATVLERSLCVRQEQGETFIWLYADDVLCIAPEMSIIDEFLSSLWETFEMTRGEAGCFIGIEIDRDREKRSIKLHRRLI